MIEIAVGIVIGTALGLVPAAIFYTWIWWRQSKMIAAAQAEIDALESEFRRL